MDPQYSKGSLGRSQDNYQQKIPQFWRRIKYWFLLKSEQWFSDLVPSLKTLPDDYSSPGKK